jgi:NADPH:quinone reductase-like Zn-dependent oxidoreductase
MGIGDGPTSIGKDALVAQTALQMLAHAQVEKGQTLLVQGAGGAVGSIAVQVAHQRGITVIATAAKNNLVRLRSYGADKVIDYTKFGQHDAYNVDAVLDTVGGEVQQKSYGLLKPQGRLIAITQPPSPEEVAKHDVLASMFITQISTEGLNEVARMTDSGEIKPLIGETLPLDEVANGWADAREKRVVGKIVFTLDS